MVSEVQVDDERVARELLKDDQRMRGGRGGWRGGDRWGDIYAGASTKKMIALYDYDPMELSPNVDMEVKWNNHIMKHQIKTDFPGGAQLSNRRHYYSFW